MSLRARLVLWAVGLLALSLAVVAMAARQFLELRLADRIADELTGEIAELRLFASRGSDPTTGAPWVDPESVLSTHLANSLTDRNEVMFALVPDPAGGVRVIPGTGEPLVGQVAQDPRLQEQLAGITSETRLAWAAPSGRVDLAAVPVRTGDGGQSGVFVVGVFADLEAAATNTVLRVLLAVSAGALLLAGALSWWTAGRALAPLQVMGATARAITATDVSGRIPLRRPGAARPDELDELSLAFNATLDRLESALASQRRLIDDAGHELRTPLTIVRGHLELLDDDPESRDAALRLVGDELDRMTRLVNDLLTLTGSADPRFLHPATLDLAVLTDECLIKASALADRDWRLDNSVEVMIRADGQRLTQAVLALVDNAVRATTVGTVIAIGSQLVDERGMPETGERARWAQIWVRDAGGGVPPEIADRIFERFTHAPDSPGAGLGLAIVAAIASAHGGRVALQAGPGTGTKFVITVPIAGPSGGPAGSQSPVGATAVDRSAAADQGLKQPPAGRPGTAGSGGTSNSPQGGRA